MSGARVSNTEIPGLIRLSKIMKNNEKIAPVARNQFNYFITNRCYELGATFDNRQMKPCPPTLSSTQVLPTSTRREYLARV